MIRRPPRSTPLYSSAASDVYKRQVEDVCGFTDLNKACPKDSYPLPSIDALVDSASGCEMLSFFDAFSGYNQINMHPRDEGKTAFMTKTCSYCYKVMPFGLKNAGATYKRLMDKVLAPMWGRNVQAYVDDMVVTSRDRRPHKTDLEELFATISKYRLKLNPETVSYTHLTLPTNREV